MQMELEQFASRLQHLRTEKGWSQSDLAREVWGELETRAGRKVAKNRDRISTYEMGKSWPDPHNLMKIANALGVSPEELAPDITAATVDRQNPEIALVSSRGAPRQGASEGQQAGAMNIATLIMQLLDYANLIASGLADPDEPPSLNLPVKPKVRHMLGRGRSTVYFLTDIEAGALVKRNAETVARWRRCEGLRFVPGRPCLVELKDFLNFLEARKCTKHKHHLTSSLSTAAAFGKSAGASTTASDGSSVLGARARQSALRRTLRRNNFGIPATLS